MSKRNRYKTSKHKVFSSPGSLIYIGKEIKEKTVIKLFEYNEHFLKERVVKVLQDCKVQPTENHIIWLDVDGEHEPEIVEAIGHLYNLHPLLMEDVLNTTQKPKVEYFEDQKQIFVVLKMLHYNDVTLEIETEHISLVLGHNFLISFQEQYNTDIFEAIQQRLRVSIGKTRRNKADYLLYSLIDLVVDNYLFVIDEVGDRLEVIENATLENPQPLHQKQLYSLKKELTYMRKSILPLRDILGFLTREEMGLINPQTHLYLRDVQDHIYQAIETLDTYRDIADNAMTNYLSTLSNKMNSVMKTLTIFTAIFMPLSFIAGLYGMNFDNMPELHEPNGYFYTLAAMASISIGLWIYFKWKKYV